MAADNGNFNGNSVGNGSDGIQKGKTARQRERLFTAEGAEVRRGLQLQMPLQNPSEGKSSAHSASSAVKAVAVAVEVARRTLDLRIEIGHI